MTCYAWVGLSSLASVLLSTLCCCCDGPFQISSVFGRQAEIKGQYNNDDDRQNAAAAPRWGERAASIVFVGKLMVMRAPMSYSIVCCWWVDDTAARETGINNNAVKSGAVRPFSQSLIWILRGRSWLSHLVVTCPFFSSSSISSVKLLSLFFRNLLWVAFLIFLNELHVSRNNKSNTGNTQFTQLFLHWSLGG